jgi:hypothetical protein
MTTTAAETNAAAPAADATITVPRAEFRVFGQGIIRDLQPRLWNGRTRLGQARTMPSETYVLSRRTRAANVKLRDGLLDIKLHAGLTPQGYEVWQPSGKFQFPITRDQWCTTARHLVVDMAEPLTAAIAYDDFVERVRSHPDLVPVDVTKTRWGFTIDDVICEYAEVYFNGARVETACVESRDYGRMVHVIELLDLSGRPNVNYVRAASAIVGIA